MIFEVQDEAIAENSLSYTINVPEIAGKRVTLSYSPATVTDEQAISSYGGIFNAPAYLISMVPRIKVEGALKVTGSGIGLGKQQIFNIKFTSPSLGTDIVTNNVSVGAYYGIGVIPDKVSQEILQQRQLKVENIRSNTCKNNLITDDCLGELLYSTVLVYFYELYSFDNIFKQKCNVADIHHVSEGIISKNINITYLLDMPVRIAEASMMIDVDRILHSTVSKSGDSVKERLFTILSGQTSSAMEGGIFEQMFRAKGVSTVKILEVANNQGIPIYTVNQQNIAAVLPKLSVSTEIKAVLQNAVNAGKHVMIPQRNVSYYGWAGIGYTIMDPDSGSGAYMVSVNASNGGWCIGAAGCTTTTIDASYFVDAFSALAVVALLEPVMLLMEYAMAELLLLGPVGWAAFAFFVALIILILVITYIVVNELQTINNPH